MPLHHLSSIHCLILLGEPGAGKSTELREEFDRIEAEDGDKIFYYDRERSAQLVEFGDIFSSSVFVEWKDSRKNLHLFIDALDEQAIETIERLMNSKFSVLSSQALQRLYLRITCRTDWWTDRFTKMLQRFWDDVAFYELASLNRQDILQAASQDNLDGETFLEEVKRQGLDALSERPMTLRLLLEEFEHHKRLFSSQAELYKRACRKLCTEINPYWHKKWQFSAKERVESASQIAALMLLTQCNVVSLEPLLEGTTDGIIHMDDLYSSQLPTTRSMIAEALHTSLFSSRGEDKLGWIHQSYAEFLAARYIKKLDPIQIKSLVFRSDGSVKPQLREVAAWLAYTEEAVFSWILQAQEATTLFHTSVSFDSTKRARLVQALLQDLEEGQFLETQIGWNTALNHNYQRLYHTGLADQLRPYIINSSQAYPLRVRKIAIEIAQACRLTTLTDDLADIALNPGEEHEMRLIASLAVSDIGTENARLKLEPLIGSVADLKALNLKGIALSALWPHPLTLEALLESLTPSNLFDSWGYSHYNSFLYSLSKYEFSAENLPYALKWAEDYLERHPEWPGSDTSDAVYHVVDSILLQAWKYLKSSLSFALVESFARTALTSLLKRHRVVGEPHPFGVRNEDNIADQFANELHQEQDMRRMIFGVALSSMVEKRDSLHVVTGYGSLIQDEDFEWLIGRLSQEPQAEIQQTLLGVIERLFNPRRSDSRYIDIMFQAMEQQPLLKQRFEDSTYKYLEARRLLRAAEAERREALSATKNPSPLEQIIQALEAFEAGSDLQWLQVNEYLQGRRSQYMPDITLLPGWEQADQELRDRLLNAGITYLKVAKPYARIHTYINYQATAVYRTFYGPKRNEIEASLWKKWVPVFFLFPSEHTSTSEYFKQHQLLAADAYNNAPDEVVAIFKTLIGEYEFIGEHEHEVFPAWHFIPKFELCWSDEFTQILYDKLADATLPKETYSSVIDFFLKRNDARVIKLALSHMTNIPTDSTSPDYYKIKRIAASLLAKPKDVSWWPEFWMAIQNNFEFIQGVLAIVADHRLDESMALYTLSENDAADFYIWFVSQYKYDDTSKYADLQRWLDTFLSRLIWRKTPEALKALRRILNELPHLESVQRGIQDIERHLRHQWQAPKPIHILDMVRRKQARYIEDEQHLLDVIIESLVTLQKDLTLDTPMSFVLWNEWQGNYRPKEEEALSDFVKYHLEKDLNQQGLIVNLTREVQVRRRHTPDGKAGEEVDIFVNAVTENDEALVIVIEVKGSWNPDMPDSMKKQLVDRYLKGNGYTYGLYLVGWFNCTVWQGGKTKNDSIESWREKLDKKAQELSRDGIVTQSFVLDARLP